jgi:xanthine dehydrogenase accessory factor
MAALDSGAGYIGALGSRRTHEEPQPAAARRRSERGRPAPDQLALRPRRRRSQPAETAIAVLGEILALRAHRAGGRPSETTGPIQSRPAEPAAHPSG